MLSQTSQREINTTWYHLTCVTKKKKKVKLREKDSKTVVARACGRGKWKDVGQCV